MTTEEHRFATPPNNAGFTRGCRCPGCRKARRDYSREWMRQARRTPVENYRPYRLIDREEGT